MIADKLFLITCIKDYPAFTGDSCSEIVKLLVPAHSLQEAEGYVIKNHLKLDIDRISDSKLLYEVIEGPGWTEKDTWEVIHGFDSEKIIKL